ncbi:MAG: diacylglycerol kinase family protein [Deltaproteobacteria bacterium]|nr:diacylglycerol kinase family protein [Deltaproteobacteria bacterium]
MNGAQKQIPDDSTASLSLLLQRRGFIASISYAVDGVLRTLLTQRNMKIHWVAGLAVMLVGMALPLDVAARASLIFCVFVVLTMETLNTAFEAFVDLHVRQYAKTAMVAKDAAAAAVLLLAAAAVVVFADILFHNWGSVTRSTEAIFRTVLLGLPLLSAMALILALPRSVWKLACLGVLACALTTILAWYSRDEVFSLGAISFVLGGLLARGWERRLL